MLLLQCGVKVLSASIATAAAVSAIHRLHRAAVAQMSTTARPDVWHDVDKKCYRCCGVAAVRC
jgi:hypothetical protein